MPTRTESLVPKILFAGYVTVFIWGAINPYYRTTWWVENVPIVGVVTALFAGTIIANMLLKIFVAGVYARKASGWTIVGLGAARRAFELPLRHW